MWDIWSSGDDRDCNDLLCTFDSAIGTGVHFDGDTVDTLRAVKNAILDDEDAGKDIAECQEYDELEGELVDVGILIAHATCRSEI